MLEPPYDKSPDKRPADVPKLPVVSVRFALGGSILSPVGPPGFFFLKTPATAVEPGRVVGLKVVGLVAKSFRGTGGAGRGLAAATEGTEVTSVCASPSDEGPCTVDPVLGEEVGAAGVIVLALLAMLEGIDVTVFGDSEDGGVDFSATATDNFSISWVKSA